MTWQRLAGKWMAPLFIVIILTVFTEICQAASSPSSVAEIIGINGQVEARVRGGSFSPASVLQKLANQDAVRTLVNSKAELSFIDQSILVLGAQSTMEISQYRLGEREVKPVRALKVLDGKVRFIVNKFLGSNTGESEFSVDTPTMGVGVRGTDGVVEIRGNTDYVYLFQAGGPVILHSKSTGEQLELKPGYFAVSQAGRPFRIFVLTDDLRRTLLRQLNMVFEVRPLGVAIQEDIPLQTRPGIVAPPAGPTQALPPIYTPPVPVPPIKSAPSVTPPSQPISPPTNLIVSP